MTITETPRGYELQFEYRPHIVRELKEMAGFRFQGKERGWVIPHVGKKKMPDGTVIENFHNKQLMEKFKAKYTQKVEGADNPEQFFKINELPELTINLPWKDGTTPYPFQNNCIARGLELKRFINAAQPGLGKSLMAIGTILGYETMGVNPYPVLVICPSTLKPNWLREVEKFTNRRGLILSDKNRNTWHQYYKMGMADFIIVNYESLWTFFVTGTTNKKGTTPTLKDMQFTPLKDMFKSVIIDELHKCFVYETTILTNKGWLQIGDIVENETPDLFAMSCDLSTNAVSLKKIKNYWKNELQERKLFKITTAIGTIICTGNHIIYTTTGPKEALSLRSGDMLFALQNHFYDETGWKPNGKILFEELHNVGNIEIAGIPSKVGSICQSGSESGQNLRMVQSRVPSQKVRKEGRENSILRAKLFSKMEDESTRTYRQCIYKRGEREIKNCRYKTNAKSSIQKNAFGQNENQQPNVESSHCGKSQIGKYGANFFRQGWQRPTYGATEKTLACITIARFGNGISNQNSLGQKSISKRTSLLQGRYRNTGNTFSHRGRWTEPRNEKMEVFGQTENRNIERIRVESCEIYEPRSDGEFGYSSIKTGRVYDIEVEDNHNYFANGILVSNCKQADSRQTRVARGLTLGKEIIIGLTGTPVVNKPKDLISQLAILNQLQNFGGYKYFLDRYCQGGLGSGNLNELNGKLNNICFFRKEKKDVLKDLPEKMHEVFTCDITTRVEYNLAKNDLGKFLKDSGYSQKQVDKSLNAEMMVKIGVLKSISARGKLPEAFEHIQEIVDAGEKIVVFIHQKFMADALLKQFPGSVSVRGMEIDEHTGKERPQSSKARQEAVDSFQRCDQCGVNQENHGKITDHDFVPNNINVIVVSIKAGGVGITLTAASRLIFLELPWHPADVEQCSDRVHRITQKNAVEIGFFLGKDTVDEDIYKMIEEKRKLSDAITGTTTDISTIISDLTRSLFNQR